MSSPFTVKEIEARMVSGLIVTMSPGEIVELKAILAGHFSFTSHALENILMKKPSVWLELRKGLRSDAATDRSWEATPDGIDEMKNRMQLKRIEKMISSVSSTLKVKEDEARHSY